MCIGCEITVRDTSSGEMKLKRILCECEIHGAAFCVGVASLKAHPSQYASEQARHTSSDVSKNGGVDE